MDHCWLVGTKFLNLTPLKLVWKAYDVWTVKRLPDFKIKKCNDEHKKYITSIQYNTMIFVVWKKIACRNRRQTTSNLHQFECRAEKRCFDLSSWQKKSNVKWSLFEQFLNSTDVSNLDLPPLFSITKCYQSSCLYIVFSKAATLLTTPSISPGQFPAGVMCYIQTKDPSACKLPYSVYSGWSHLYRYSPWLHRVYLRWGITGNLLCSPAFIIISVFLYSSRT